MLEFDSVLFNTGSLDHPKNIPRYNVNEILMNRAQLNIYIIVE